jgi:excisionase family DNA binding protein
MEDWYTVSEAARILKVTEPRIRQLLLREEMEGEKDPLSDRWRIPQHAVHARLESHKPREDTRSADQWMERVAELERELGRVEGRLELTEAAESTLRESLERERERADEERQRADSLEKRAEQLRDELAAERSKGFWSRLFGG